MIEELADSFDDEMYDFVFHFVPWFVYREHLSTKAHPTLKPSSTQEPTSFRARHTKLTLQQHRNLTLSTKIQTAKSHTKPTDTSKLSTGHFIALQRKEIQLHPAEHRGKLP